jgi:hypothetical protein
VVSKATAAAAAATELVDRKRKAAAAAEDDLNSSAGLTQSCYGTEAAADVSSNTAPSTASPVYCAVSPVYSKVVAPSTLVEKTQRQSTAAAIH